MKGVMKGVLVRAGPGTGKTLSIIDEIIRLVKEENVDPSKILCITYTNSAVEEITTRLNSKLGEKAHYIEVHTFHSFALDKIDTHDFDVIPDSVKRFVIYRSLIDHNVFNYTEEFIRDKFLSSIVAMIDYIRCYGVTVDKIKNRRSEIMNRLKQMLSDQKRSRHSLNLDDYTRFLDHLISIYQDYEDYKQQNKCYDYTDMLYAFIEQHKDTVFDYDYVFIDELQDVNILEAKVAEMASNKHKDDQKTFLYLVGDAKQSIFGFQGGSLVNFHRFGEEYAVKELTENHRSCQAIVEYSAEYMKKNSRNEKMIKEANSLKPVEDLDGNAYYTILNNNDDLGDLILRIINENNNAKIGIITRTNTQAEEISKILSEKGIEHYCSAPRLGSLNVKRGIIDLLDSLLHLDDPQKLVNGISSPFSGVNLPEIIKMYDSRTEHGKFRYSAKVGFDKIKDNTHFSRFVEMAELINFKPDGLYDSTKNLEKLFLKFILPVSVSFGREGLLSAVKLYGAVLDYFEHIGSDAPKNLLLYLQLVDVSEKRSLVDSNISVLTVHQAKGRTFETVIYLPTRTRGGYKLIENMEHAILSVLTNGYDKDEIDEESVRIDYVALTRAKHNLYMVLSTNTKSFKERYIFSPAVEYRYSNPVSSNSRSRDMADMMLCYYGNLFSEFIDSIKREDMDNILKLARSFSPPDRNWMKELITDSLKERCSRLSYSLLDASPVQLFIEYVLRIPGMPTKPLELGKRIHEFYEELYRDTKEGKEKEISDDDEKLWSEQWQKCFNKLSELDPVLEQVGAEEIIELQSSAIEKIFGFRPAWAKKIVGKIDAVFEGKDDTIWIVDYKTSKTPDNNYKSQLMFYRLIYSEWKNIHLSKINTAIFYVLLRSVVNDRNGKPVYSVEVKTFNNSNRSSAEKEKNKLVDKLKTLDTYINNPDIFINDLEEDIRGPFFSVQYKDLIMRFIEEYKIANKQKNQNI